MVLQNWWLTTLLGIETPINPPLCKDIKADIVIIGGGMAGLSAAMALKDSKLKVVLLERNICGGSTTGKSAGFLTPDSELELSQVLRRYGKDGAKDLWDAPVRGIKSIVENVKQYDIKCDLQTQDSLYVALDKGGWSGILEEGDARKELGFPQTLYKTEELGNILGATGYHGGVRYPETYGINAMEYVQGIKRVLMDAGVEIYESSTVTKVISHTVETSLGSVTAEQIINCADKPKAAYNPYADNVFHAQTFLSISEPLSDKQIIEMFPDGHLQCWDSSLVYTYFRLTGDNRVLLGGGSALSTFSMQQYRTTSVIDGVIAGFKKKFPFLKQLEFIQYWPGLIDCTRDLMPTVMQGENAPWIHYVMGSVGLPWACFCGDFAARHVLNSSAQDDKRYYNYFRYDRGYLMPIWTESVIGKPLVFAMNNSWSKYYQVDKSKMNYSGEIKL